MTSTKAKEIADDYFSSLKDLTINSKPLINMLTMLAEDNVEHAEAIVEAVENHLQKVESKYKLPVLYLIDSIVKNVNGAYLNLFTQNIVNTFCGVFEKVDEATRASMWKLRQTWNGVFPATKLYSLDVRVQSIDPAWPITASPPTISSGSIHLNPRFLSMSQVSSTQAPSVTVPLSVPSPDLTPIKLNSKREELINQQKKLLELQKQKVELELLQAKLNFEEQQKELDEQDAVVKSGMILPTAMVVPTTEAIQGKPVAPVMPSQVVKQVSKQVSRDKKLKNEFPAATASLLKNAGTTNGPRIAPASSLMVASARQTSRDPRLKSTTQQPPMEITQVTSTSSITTVLSDQLKQQLTMKKASNIKPTMNNPPIGEGSLKPSINDNPINNNKPLNSCKDSVSNRSNQKKERTSSNSNNSLSINNAKLMNQVGISTNSSLSANLLSSVSSNTSVNRSHSDNRVKDSKRDTSSSRCDKTTVSSKSSHRKLGNKTRLKQSSTSPTKLIKLDREASPVRSKSRDKESSDSSPTSLRTSPQSSSPLSKNRKKLSGKGRKRSPSPYRIPRRNLNAKEVSTSIVSTGGLTEEEQSGSLIVSPPHPPAFKDIRQNTRQRNYIRRNKEGPGSSPEQSGLADDSESLIESASKDEDLRAALPPTSVAVVINEKKDLDLRVLPPVNKRQSAEHIDGGASKRTKTEKFDALFGHEDVDLRTLTNPKAGRPPTPPPPVISGDDNKASWAKLKTPSKNDREKQTSFDEKRDRDRNKDRLGRPRLYKLSDDPKDRRRGFSSDEDSRPNRRNKDTDKSDLSRGGRNIEIIMKQAEEQWRDGSISKTEYHKLIQEIWQMNEDQKLRAAQRKEKEIGSLVWEKGIDIGGYSPNDGDMGHRKDHHNRNGPRWNQPWQPGPWAHPPFGPGTHFNPEFRPVGPWQNPRFPPMRPDFNQFHGGFNSNIGPRMGGMMGPMGPNGPMMPGIMPNGPMGPLGINPLNINGPAGLLMNGPPRGNLLGHLPNPVTPVNTSVPPSSPPQLEDKYTPEENGRPNRELPCPDPQLLEEIASDTMKSINIDNMPREIRYYGSVGVVFMSWDDPREIGFQDGARRILIDDKDTIMCAFNEPYKEFLYENEVHKIKLGAPTRELYIDDRWYECYFGGPPITVDLGSKKVGIKLEGPPPQVKIGSVKRTDLVIAKINLIINARTMVPVFLDAKPQIFELDGQNHTLEFTDSLKTVMLNGRPFAVEFGGLPKPIMIGDKKHFIRFSVLPRGVRAGAVKIAGMKGESPDEGSNDVPVVPEKSETSGGSVSTSLSGLEQDSVSQDASDLQSGSKSDLQLDMLSSALSTAMAPASGMSYEAEPTDKPIPAAPVLPLNLNLNELFQRLVDTGIVPKITGAAADVKKETEVKKEPEAPPILFDKPETLKMSANPVPLYSGMQCGSCSLRFGPDRPMKYSAHLDWHFRQNRRERDSARKAHSRAWYYDTSDWTQFETCEESDDRARSWFEMEKQNAETEGANTEDTPQETILPSVPTGGDEDAQCQVCHDAFEQFYNEEKEEWHLRPAVSFEDKNYHPLCLEDHKEKCIARALEKSAMSVDESATDAEDDKKEDVNEAMETSTDDVKDPELEPKDESTLEESTDENKIPLEESTEQAEEQKPENQEEVPKSPDEEMKPVDEENIESLEQPLEGDSEGKCEELVDEKVDEESLDVVKIKEEPIDSMETDEPTFDFSNVEVKAEPLEPEPEPIVPESGAPVDTTLAAMTSSIDGNVELESAGSTIPASQSKIKINITKTLVTANKEPEEPKEKPQASETPTEENPQLLVPASMKPSLQGRKLSVLPPVQKGHELSGLCSIM
ncbi:uncharacterized protein LOC107041696 isoform X2 [Diachasma alloeum]|uniref:uncharacterized protein LOC107041696 isoform X2 n=1 Tax=Diachasma alloeum TaxID=454923 RepID=UPI0007382F08|nr:uncharacterized protein LOC107041696 isoform X2 [Diachasma alloeum]